MSLLTDVMSQRVGVQLFIAGGPCAAPHKRHFSFYSSSLSTTRLSRFLWFIWFLGCGFGRVVRKYGLLGGCAPLNEEKSYTLAFTP